MICQSCRLKLHWSHITNGRATLKIYFILICPNSIISWFQLQGNHSLHTRPSLKFTGSHQSQINGDIFSFRFVKVRFGFYMYLCVSTENKCFHKPNIKCLRNELFVNLASVWNNQDTSWHWGTHLSLIFTILCLSWPCFHFTDMSTSVPEELQIYVFHWCLKPLRSENFFIMQTPSWSQNLGFSSLIPKFPSFTSCTKSLLYC